MKKEDEVEISPESTWLKNFAEDLSEQELSRIAEECLAGYKNDLDSLSGLIMDRKEYNDLFNLSYKDKNYPWPKASNVKLPIITKSCINFQARASINMFSGFKIVKALPSDSTQDSIQRADRVAKHMNNLLMFDMPNFYPGFDTTLIQLPKDGYAFRKTFWDSIQKKVISDYILPEDFVVNYYTKSLDTSYRYTHVLKLNENEIRTKGFQGIYVNTDDLNAPVTPTENEETAAVKIKQGLSEPDSDYTTPREVLEMHTFVTLSKDEKLRKPYVITIDYLSRKILRIVTRTSPVDGKPINYFTHYTFIPNDKSIFGFGFGMLLLGIAKSMNTSINQMHDSAHLSAVRGGWVLKGSAMNRGNITFTMGQFQEVNARVDDIRKAIMPMEFAPPSSVLLQLLEFLKGLADELTTVTEIMSGQQPKSDTTATGASLAVEQGAKVFTSIQQRLFRQFSPEAEKIRVLNSIFMEDSEYLDATVSPPVNGNPDQPDQKVNLNFVSKEDYASPMRIMLVADPNIISEQQTIAKAEFLNQVVTTNPFLAQNPEAITLVMKRRLQAASETDDVIASLEALMAQSIQDAKNQSLIQAQQAQQIEEQKQVEMVQGHQKNNLDIAVKSAQQKLKGAK